MGGGTEGLNGKEEGRSSMRTVIPPSEGDSTEYINVHLNLGLSRSFWDALSEVASQRGYSGLEALHDAIEAGILRLRLDTMGSEAVTPRPDRIQNVLRLPVLMPGQDGLPGNRRSQR